jgi:hypothetical protein
MNQRHGPPKWTVRERTGSKKGVAMGACPLQRARSPRQSPREKIPAEKSPRKNPRALGPKKKSRRKGPRAKVPEHTHSTQNTQTILHRHHCRLHVLALAVAEAMIRSGNALCSILGALVAQPSFCVLALPVAISGSASSKRPCPGPRRSHFGSA